VLHNSNYFLSTFSVAGFSDPWYYGRRGGARGTKETQIDGMPSRTDPATKTYTKLTQVCKGAHIIRRYAV